MAQSTQFARKVQRSLDADNRVITVQLNLEQLRDAFDKLANKTASGAAIMAGGTTTVAVTYGATLLTPVVTVTPQGNVGNWWITPPSNTGFTITAAVAPGSAVTFNWVARGV